MSDGTMNNSDCLRPLTDLDENFDVWLEGLGKLGIETLIQMSSSSGMVELDRSKLREKSKECLAEFVAEATPLFSPELKKYLLKLDVSLESLSEPWDQRDPPPPSEWPMEMDTRVSFNLGKCLRSEPLQPVTEPVTDEFVQQLVESCVETPLPTAFVSDPSKVSSKIKQNVCTCLTNAHLELGLAPSSDVEPNKKLNWNYVTGVFGATLGASNPNDLLKYFEITGQCYELLE